MLAAISWKDFLHPLALFGFAGQFVFMLRFVVQWLASERRGRSYVPVVFWWISLCGGIMLFSYATLREDVVFMCGQLLGLGVYGRNLVLIYRRKARLRDRTRRETAPASVDGNLASRSAVSPGSSAGLPSPAGETPRQSEAHRSAQSPTP